MKSSSSDVIYLLVLLNLKFSVQLLRLSFSSYLVSLTSLSKEEDKKLNVSTKAYELFAVLCDYVYFIFFCV